MSGYRSLRGLATFVVVLLAANLFVDLALIASGVLQLELLGRMALGDFSDAEVAANDTREMVMGAIATCLYFVTGIAFMAWFRRAYENLDHFGHTRAHGTGWAIGSFIVPIISLFRPFQIAREIWHASDPDSLGGGDPTITPSLLASWWGAWVLGNVVGQVALRTTMSASSGADFQVSTTWHLVSNAVTLVSAPLAILVVRELTRRQEARAAGLAHAENVARIFE